ncbi:MAG: GNAT family N-acetyltransferase [Chloroflexi bacterium]|nr:GNAT family N-acetyltransferase [Chloroflexota bacterium]
MKPIIRPYRSADFDAINILWRISREKSLPDFQQRKGYFFYQDMAYFRDHILTESQVWVLEESETGRPAAFMAVKDDFIEHLYVHPDHWRKGLGGQLLQFVRTLSPQHLWLYTLQVNHNARAFYEKNGFVIASLGISPPPESEPDVRYEWFLG